MKFVFSAAARRELRAIPQADAYQILRSLDRWALEGSGDIKQLSGIQPPQFRLRVGGYRARFSLKNGEVHVVSVRKRSEAYR